MKTDFSTYRQRLAVISITLVNLSVLAKADPVSSYWMNLHGLTENDLVFDLDNDGYPTDAEFYLGTDPLDSQSALDPRLVTDQGTLLLEWDTIDGVAYQIEESHALDQWEAMGGSIIGTGETFEMPVEDSVERRFYRFTPVFNDSDGDCLTDFEEIHLLGTDPNNPDSDGDGISDGDEVKRYHTDPNFASTTGRGTIRGKVVRDEDSDPATRIHPGIENWTVFLDTNLNGNWDPNEPSSETAADGSYLFQHLDPGYYRVCAALPAGWLQVFPETDAPYSADGYPDAIAEIVDSGDGDLPMPYGINKQSEVEHKLILGLSSEPVDPAIILGQTPKTPYAPPLGLWSDVDFMGISQGSHVTVEFSNEEIIDDPGIDIVVASLDQPAGEQANIYLGRTLEDMQLAGQYAEGGDIGIDLDAVGILPPIQFARVEALDNLGGVQGFDLVGFEAIHFQPPPRGHYDVTIAGGDEITDIDFGIRGVDRPPHVFVHSLQSQVLEGNDVTLKVTSSDDLGLASQTLSVNGQPVTLNSDGEASYATSYAGILYAEAKAVDTTGQESISQLQLLILNADGSLPDLSGVGIDSPATDDAPTITIFSPFVGEILEAPSPIVGTITPANTAISDWCVEYASTSLVDPHDLETADPDYILLGQGSGTVINQTLATFPADTLSPDTYLIRIKATGGATRYFGFVVAVGLTELDIRPDIELISPATNTDITYLTDIIGSVTTRQTLREWTLEYAPLSEVNLDNLGDSGPSYTQIASGTDPITDSVLGTFDPTLLPNDAYLLRITAWNTNGLGWTDGLVLNVMGEAKLGNFALEFIDLALPCAGIPIEVKRVYDSLNADKQGDFGHGWKLGIQDADIQETVPQTGSAFLATAFEIGTRVYLTAPDGARIGFTFDIEAGPSGFLGQAYSAKFIPDPGVNHTLEVPEGNTAFLSVSETGQVSLFFINLAFNPDVYILTDTLGLRYTYHQDDGLIEIEDPNGNKVIFGDDGIEHTAGPKVEFTRDSKNRITSITGPTGQVWQYHYDTNGDLTQITYPTNEIATFGYASDPAHFLTDYDNAFGAPSQTIEYDADGRVAAIIDAEGNRQEQTWNPAFFTGTFTDARGNVTTYEYDDFGNVVRQINPPGGGEILYEYNDPNDPTLETAITDPNGNKTVFEYDANGNRTVRSSENPTPLSGYIYRWEYDADGNTTKYLPAQGAAVDIEYDGLGNPTVFRLGSSLREYHLSYTSTGLLATFTDPNGGLTVLEYDGPWSNPTKITLPDGSTQLFEYNDIGAMTKHVDQAGAESQMIYDQLSRVVSTIDHLGTTTSTTYHEDTFQPETQIDELNRITTYTYTEEDRLKSVRLHDNSTILYEYDADGNLTAIIDAIGNRSEFTYDANDRLMTERDAAGAHRTHSYDFAGNRIATTDRNGRKRTFVYDTRNRMVTENWHDTGDDTVIRTITFEYDRLNRQTKVADPDATIIFRWPLFPDGKLSSERITYPGRAERSINFSYDNADQLTRLGYNGSLNAVHHVRDSVGRSAILKLEAQGDNVRTERDFNGRGDVISERRFADVTGNQLAGVSNHAIDPRGWVNEISHLDAAGVQLPDGLLTFTRNAYGEISQRTVGTETITYGRDAIGQLTSANWSSASATDEVYSYDPNGNRLLSHLHASYAVTAGNRVTESGDWILDYDNEGNLIRRTHKLSGEMRELSYDYRNRLTKVVQQLNNVDPLVTLSEYRYDPLDRRSAVVKPGQTLWTYYANNHPFIEYLDTDSDLYRMYLYGDQTDELLGLWQSGEGTLWALTDNLGSVRSWLDRSGNVVGTFEYDSFGNILSSTGLAQSMVQPSSYTARQWDADAQLYHYRARYYDPQLGRFINEDPIGFDGDRSNLYRYVENGPTQATDPSGLSPIGEFTTFIIKSYGIYVILKKQFEFQLAVIQGINNAIRSAQALANLIKAN